MSAARIAASFRPSATFLLRSPQELITIEPSFGAACRKANVTIDHLGRAAAGDKPSGPNGRSLHTPSFSQVTSVSRDAVTAGS
jgi:hypothetical protein